MAKNSFVDIFDLCWNAILMESKDHGNVFFSEKHCSEYETRDKDFDIVENRLAYLHKFGCFNAVFVEKCVESFLTNFSEGKNLFLRDNLKVCSVSNGPGLDLIGLLCGIFKSNQNFKSFPVFRTINLFSSWWSICCRIFASIFKAASASSNDNFDMPSEIIHFVQCDIYSTLSHDVEECIKESDILLMTNVFASSKATSDVVIKSMKEISSHLKQGSFVFFVGSKKKTKELAANNLLNKFVNCILGPIKISVAELPFNGAAMKSSVKPKESGSAYFIVWQKKDSVLTESICEDIPQKKKKKKRKKNINKSIVQVQEVLADTTFLSEQMTDDNDEGSDTLFSSCSKQFETLSDEFSSTSCEKISQSISPVEINFQNLGKEVHILSPNDSLLSLDSITSLLDKININPETENSIAIKDVPESGKESICILERNSQERESENCVVKEVIVQTKNKYLLNEIKRSKQTADLEIVQTKVSSKPESQLVEDTNFCDKPNMKPVTHQKKELHLKQKYALPVKENSTYPAKSNILVKSSNEKESVQFNTILSSKKRIPNLKKNNQIKENEAQAVSQADFTCFPSNVHQAVKSKTIANQVTDYFGLKKDFSDEASNSNSSSRKSSINNLHGINTLKNVTPNMTSSKTFLELNIGSIKNNSRSRITPENQPHEKNLDFKVNIIKERTSEINNGNKELNSILQCCENLVTSLEKLTDSIKNSISLNDQDTRCCIKKSCTTFQIQHAYINSCCINAVHSHCCKKVCNCHMFNLNTYATCPKHFHERGEPK